MTNKKEQLKSLFKPLIKECVKELILEEGVLSSLISEVQKSNRPEKRQEVVEEAMFKQQAVVKKDKIDEAKRRIYSALGSDNYASIFENIDPLTNYEAGETPASSMGNPLSGQAPNDPGVDITSIPGMNVWKTIATDKKR
jgi:hypothetical protein